MRKTAFGLFESYADAAGAVRELEQRGFDRQDINVIVQIEAIRDRYRPDAEERLQRQPSQAAEQGSTTAQAVQRLHEWLASQPVVRLPTGGEVYAANDVAVELAEKAQVKVGGGGLKAALQDYGVSAHYAEAYHAGVDDGWLLVFVTTSDDRVIEASEVLEQHEGRRVFIYTPER